MDPRTVPLPPSPIPTRGKKTLFHDNRICLNVGGVRYDVSRELMMRHEESLLASLFNTWNQEKNEIFIFRNGQLFAYVLDYVRSGKVHLPSTVSKVVLKEELDYYQIPVDMSHFLEDRDFHCVDRLNIEIREHKAAVEEKKREVAAIVESHRLAHQFAESVVKKGYNWSSILSPSTAAAPGVDKKVLHGCLLSRGLDVFGYQLEETGARVSLGPILQEEGKGLYGQSPIG